MGAGEYRDLCQRLAALEQENRGAPLICVTSEPVAQLYEGGAPQWEPDGMTDEDDEEVAGVVEAAVAAEGRHAEAAAAGAAAEVQGGRVLQEGEEVRWGPAAQSEQREGGQGPGRADAAPSSRSSSSQQQEPLAPAPSGQEWQAVSRAGEVAAVVVPGAGRAGGAPLEQQQQRSPMAGERQPSKGWEIV